MTKAQRPPHALTTLLSPHEPAPDPLLATAEAALYFLPEGHFLFCDHSNQSLQSKFVTAASVAHAFSTVTFDTDWLTPGIIRCGYSARGPWYIYWHGPTTVSLQLQGPGSTAVTTPLPATVMLGTGGRHHIWALQTAEFYPDAPAYHMPTPNVYPDGRVCWGSVHPPETEQQAAPGAWDIFTRSAFTTALITGKSVQYKQDIRRMLITLAEQQATVYPVEDLQPLNKTITEAITAASSNASNGL